MTDHTITELSALSGLPVRTIRYYVAQGLVPSPEREGPATRYPESTLARLRLIRKLQNQHLPLAEIRRRLAEIPDEEAIELAAAQEAPAPEGSALDYIRSLLEGELAADAYAAPPRAQLPWKAARDVPAPLPYASDQLELPTRLRSVNERSQWERISLGPDIELHVRRPLSRRDNRMVERLVAFARQLQGEETP